MICEICGKNEATIHIQEVINGKKKVMHICKECADTKKAAKELISGLDLAKLMYNISAQINDLSTNDSEISDFTSPLKCDRCGWTLAKFTSVGRFGCKDCFEIFMPLLSEALRNMHRGIIHVGKRPASKNKSKADAVKSKAELLIELQNRLKQYIQNEEYEKAAETRDEIAALKAELNKNEKQNQAE